MAKIEAVLGKDKILMFRNYKDRTKKAAGRLALQTEHEISRELDSSTRQTKDGAVNSPGGIETTISIQALAERDDGISAMLSEAVENGDLIEVWEVDVGSRTPEGQCDALYGQGYLDSWSEPAPADDFVEIDTNMNINGKMQKGKVTISEEEMEAIAYAFATLEQVTTGEG